jgi:hypothetical protein
MTFGIVEKLDVALVEDLKKAVPIDAIQSLFRLSEINAKHAAGALDLRRVAAMGLDPFADLFVISRVPCACHRFPPLYELQAIFPKSGLGESPRE